MMENKWYILNVMVGQENKVASEIKVMMERGRINQYIKEALVPAKQIIKVKRGQKVEESQKLFPGYVFVNGNVNGDAYNLLSSIPKVIGFLGAKNRPEPVSNAKMEEIFTLSAQKNSSKDFTFEVGEVVSVTDGPFESFSGSIEEFDAEKRKVKISVMIFGRPTSVELDVTQVERSER